MTHVFKHPKYYEELRKQGRKLSSNKPTSSQASSDKRPSHKPRVQASSQK